MLKVDGRRMWELIKYSGVRQNLCPINLTDDFIYCRSTLSSNNTIRSCVIVALIIPKDYHHHLYMCPAQLKAIYICIGIIDDKEKERL